MPTLNIPLADLEGTQLRVSNQALFEATMDFSADPVVCTHNAAYVTEWADALAQEQAADPILPGGMSQVEFDAAVTSSTQPAFDGKSNIGHTHSAGTISYNNATSGLSATTAKGGIDELAAGKANNAHNHVAADVTDFDTEVNAAVAAYLIANPPSGGQTLTVAQVRNSAATSNLNHSTTWSNIVIDGLEDEMDAGFTNGATGIECNFTGRVKVTTHIGYTVSGSRVNVLVRAAVAGTGQGIQGKSGYVRNASGHTEASATAIQYINVTNGDEVTLQTKRESSATTNTLGDVGGCMILLERTA